MENIPVIGQTSQLLAGGIVLLALTLGIIFYYWSLGMFKKIELMTTKMKQNIDSLEDLSQSIYENIYLQIKKEKTDTTQNKSDIKPMSEKKIQGPGRQTVEEQTASTNTRPVEFSRLEETNKYKDISEFVKVHLKSLLAEKEQVTAQELVYDIPNQYSLAEIYRTLEEMKERNQISWEGKNISPQSILKPN